MQAYVRIQWKRIEDFYALGSHSTTAFRNVCEKRRGMESFRFYCEFATLVLGLMGGRVRDESFPTEVEQTFARLDESVGLYTQPETENHKYMDNYNSRHEKSYYKYRKNMVQKGKFNWRLVKAYLYLVMLEVAQAKSARQDLNVMRDFLRRINATASGPEPPSDICTFGSTNDDRPKIQHLLDEDDLARDGSLKIS